MHPEPVVVAEHPELVVRALHVSDMDNVAYLVTCRTTGRQGLVDAADDAPGLLGMVAAGAEDTSGPVSAPGLDWVVTTHGHWDHHRALPDVVAATGAQVLAGTADAGDLPTPVARTLEQGDTVTLGDLTFEVVHLRGHTPGSVALVLRPRSGPPMVFTGDSLFPGGVGNTRGDAAAFGSLIDDVESRLFAVLPDGTAVLPGHGAPTTLGAERPELPRWRERGW